MLRLVFVLGFGPALFSIASANTDVWINNVSGNFGDPNNWSAGVPGTSDNVIYGVGTGASFTVTFAGQPLVQGTKSYASGTASVGSVNVTFAQSTSIVLGPSTYAVPALVTGGSMAVPSVLNTSLLSFSTQTASIGLGSNSPGTLNVNGGTFQVTGSTSDEELIIGDNGSGSSLNVNAGAQLSLTGDEGNAVIGNSAGVNGTANVTGAGAVWTNASNDAAAPLVIGNFGNGTLNITAGGQLSDFAGTIAGQTDSTGAATVSGAESSWTNRGTLIVGGGGTGTLNVSAGGHLSNDSLVVGGTSNGMLTISAGGSVTDNASFIGSASMSTGSVNVTGTGSKWSQTGKLTIGGETVINGSGAIGSLHIAAGGQVNTGGDADVGSAGSGTVRVEGAGSQWNVGGAMNVDETGSITIVAGAKSNANSATVAGSVAVDEVGSAWSIADYLDLVGPPCLGQGCMATPASVSVGDSAKVSTRVAQIGGQLGSAQVIVDSASSTWSTTEQLYVGLAGSGKFMVTGGAHVTSGSTEIGVSPSGNGAVSIDESTWTNEGDFDVGVAGAGKLTVSSGGMLTSSGTLAIGPHGTVEGDSQVQANVRNEGHVSPGIAGSSVPANTIGKLHIDGAYGQNSGGALDIELASAASYDKLLISGAATLDGTLNVTLFNGFVPAVGNSFDLLSAGDGITDRFTSVNVPPLFGSGHGPFWTLVYTSSAVILKLVNSPTGDYNHDGVVDAADYAVWRDSLGQSGLGLAADGDGNHVIDLNDFNIWKTNFGQTAGSAAATTDAAPEPTTCILLFAASICLFGWRNRPRNRQ
jgi:T5SS/PEP-CTERM-associated repeat protein